MTTYAIPSTASRPASMTFCCTDSTTRHPSSCSRFWGQCLKRRGGFTTSSMRDAAPDSCEPMLKPYARSLTGVDLSPGMLIKARARMSYDDLHEDEITRFLCCPHCNFRRDRADTLCYFGELQLFAQVAHRALQRGWVAFTVERGDGVQSYRLLPHGRYCHARAYVEVTLMNAGFESIHVAQAVFHHRHGPRRRPRARRFHRLRRRFRSARSAARG